MSRLYKSAIQNIVEEIDEQSEVVLNEIGRSVAIQLKQLRESRRLSQLDLAKLLGTGQSRVSQMEDVNYGKLSISSLAKASICLNFELQVVLKPIDPSVSSDASRATLFKEVEKIFPRDLSPFLEEDKSQLLLPLTDLAEMINSADGLADNVLRPGLQNGNQKWVA